MSKEALNAEEDKAIEAALRPKCVKRMKKYLRSHGDEMDEKEDGE